MSSRRAKRVFQFTLSALLPILTLAGCGQPEERPVVGEPARASGTVTFDGKPVESGTIVFIPLNVPNAVSARTDIVDGKYAIEENGPIVGQHRVEIMGYRKTGRTVPDSSPAGRKVSESGAPTIRMVEEREQYLPAGYNTNSNLTATIASGDNVQDFNLKRDGS